MRTCALSRRLARREWFRFETPASGGRGAAGAPRADQAIQTYQFFEAVKARQAAAICGDGLDHQRDLELLDAGIDAVNNLIASQCSGS